MRTIAVRSAWLLLAVLLSACGSGADVTADAPEPTADPDVVDGVTSVFEQYRDAVMLGDADRALDALDDASIDDMARVVEVARTADEPTVRSLPASDQLLVLTYRLRPELLEADDPYAALVEGGFGGQDRPLGDLGEVSSPAEDRALGVVLDAQTGAPTPLRWRFVRQEGTWRFDLIEAHRLLSQAFDGTARRAGLGVDEVVAATLVDLSGERTDTVEALFTERPG